MAISVTGNAERDRYEASVDGVLAGFAAYRLDDSTIEFTHTEVEGAHEGHGVGANWCGRPWTTSASEAFASGRCARSCAALSSGIRRTGISWSIESGLRGRPADQGSFAECRRGSDHGGGVVVGECWA